MTARNKTYSERWLEEYEYYDQWTERNRALWALFQNAERIKGKTYAVSEIGCGAKAPFCAVVSTDKTVSVQKYDIKAWDADTVECDLNADTYSVKPADIAVLSGVLEYVNDLEQVLQTVITNHRFLLLSYAYMPLEALQTDQAYLNVVFERSVKHGWRNHYTNIQIVEILQNLGVISNTGLWNAGQSLFVVRAF